MVVLLDYERFMSERVLPRQGSLPLAAGMLCVC